MPGGEAESSCRAIMSLLKLMKVPVEAKALPPEQRGVGLGWGARAVSPGKTLARARDFCWHDAPDQPVVHDGLGSLRWAGLTQALFDCQSSLCFLLSVASSASFPFGSPKTSCHEELRESMSSPPKG